LEEVEDGSDKKSTAGCLFGIGLTFVQPAFYFLSLETGNGRKLGKNCTFSSFFLDLVKSYPQEQKNNYDQKRD